MTDTNAHHITSLAELDALYGAANPLALAKEAPRLTEPYRRFVELAPFIAIATQGAGGLDCTPRGDPGAVAVVLDDKTVAIPDRRGNNRLDTLRNLVADPRIALLFLIPGANETLRINGRAVLSTDPDLIRRTTMEDKAPKCVIVVTIDTVYFQCGKALVRSRLWQPEGKVERALIPTAGQMAAAAVAGFDGTAYDAELPARQTATLY